ncbi:MAG: GTP 3',8-cyclase MoaA [Gammaproteobacteria bacterium]
MSQPITQSAPELRDAFGRQVTYLRMSVTDRCDFRCRYCMDENPAFLPRKSVLSLEELALIGKAFIGLGVTKIRLTGGEPLVRRDMLWLVQQLGAEEGLHDFAMTTNGSQLAKQANALAAAGLHRLNVSVDTLDADTFKDLTRIGDLAQVLDGIEHARRAGFRRIKLNSVVMRGFNDQQILPLIDYVLERGMDISFIEEMPLGVVTDHSRKDAFISSQEIRDSIATRYPLASSTFTSGGPSRYWKIDGYENSRIGFISPHSENFCSTCNRVRLTAEGKLLLCLGHENALDLREVTRAHPESIAAIQDAVLEGIQNKPERHEFSHDPDVKVLRYMHHTGG